MEFPEVINSIYEGMKIKKPRVESTILSIAGTRIRYSIGNKGNSKYITTKMLEDAFKEVTTNGEISKAWFNKMFPNQANTSPCSFTTIGGILEHVGLVRYNKSKYIKS